PAWTPPRSARLWTAGTAASCGPGRTDRTWPCCFARRGTPLETRGSSRARPGTGPARTGPRRARRGGGEGMPWSGRTRAPATSGLPDPPRSTLTAQACLTCLRESSWPEGLEADVEEHLRTLEGAMGKRLGDADDPLLVSVRSGAKFSMPGMMDTVLNLGLNDA